MFSCHCAFLCTRVVVACLHMYEMYYMLILHVSCPNLLDFRGKNIQRIKVINESPVPGNEEHTPKFQRGVGYLSAL